MKNVIYNKDEMNVPVKVWADGLDEKTIEQVKAVSRLPFIHKWVSLMPDAHFGFGVPIGSVVPCDGYIVPSIVSSDIGCGMCVLNTGMHIDDVNVDALMRTLQDRVAIIAFDDMNSKGHYRHASIFKNMVMAEIKTDSVLNRVVNKDSARTWTNLGRNDSILKQMGTLGDSNHFYEVQTDSNGIVHLMIHSGSRGFGGAIGNSYNKLAKAMCEKWHSNLPSNDLAYLPMDSDEGRSYFKMMNLACDYAYMNRYCMMFEGASALGLDRKFVDGNMINIHHNYAAIENHYGKNVVVHRKGATCVRKGVTGIIPGSMTTKSYIVDGLGSTESFHSCSHGSGRPFSRTEARKRVEAGTDASQEDQLTSAGVTVYGAEDVSDELGTSYKDISTVMDLQTDLVSIRTELTPVAVLKG